MKPRYVAVVNRKTGNFEVYDTQTKETLDPRQCADRLNRQKEQEGE